MMNTTITDPEQWQLFWRRTQTIPESIVVAAGQENEWFDPRSVRCAWEAFGAAFFCEEAIRRWIGQYDFSRAVPRNVGIIMAGNIPFVGAADLFAVLLCGSRPFVKYASKDRVLMEWMSGEISRFFGIQIPTLAPDSPIALLIATGSDNANRYFNELYPSVPRLLRGSRTSVAVLDGTETPEELTLLHTDCFRYYGLGCRNVQHLLVPRGYDFSVLVSLWQQMSVDHPSFRHNYLQQRALQQMTAADVIDGGYFTLVPSTGLFANISQITFSYHDSQPDRVLEQWGEALQCVVGHRYIPFGAAQHPAPEDYPDGKDTVAFLLGAGR